jgi:hypothetical protein
MTEINSVSDALNLMPEHFKLGVSKIPRIGERKDESLDMDTEVGAETFWNQLTPENISELNPDIKRNILVINTSPHTSSRVQNPSKQSETHLVPAHFVAFNKNKTNDLTPDGLKNKDIRGISKTITAAYAYLKETTRIPPVFYSLKVYSPKKDPDGFSDGTQSVLWDHWHVGYPPVPNSDKQELSDLDKLKYFSPVGLLFKDEYKDLADRLIDGEVGNTHEPNNPLATGVHIKLKDSNKLDDYLDLVYKFVGKLNFIYKDVIRTYEELNLSDFDKHEEIIENTINRFTGLGLDRDLAQRIIDKGKIFKPTLMQIENWLKKDDLSAEVRTRLEKMELRYLRLRKRTNVLSNSLLKKMVDNQLLTGADQKKPNLTLPKNIPLKVVCTDSKLSKNGQVEVYGMDISLLILSLNGNTAENLGSLSGGTIIRRG